MARRVRQLLLVGAVSATVALAACPFGFGRKGVIGKLSDDDMHFVRSKARTPEYELAASTLNWDSVVADLKELFTTDQPLIYPIDRMLDGTSTYAPFFVRQAWHCSGSYRVTDGLGGCGGGRQRFNPELSWADNTNLDKAKRLLWTIKEKYGLGLSWGDLMILAGKVAIETMGGPHIDFCAGRPDDEDGYKSELLGPTAEQEVVDPCPVQGECSAPFGTTNIGLIYVNPQGHMNNYAALQETVRDINVTFAHMSMDEEETVALIGGGHAFGKTHGACKLNTSNPEVWPDPLQDPANPWPITACKNGTWTTGFEGFWTSKPNQWSNEYFQRLADNSYTAYPSAGGATQYQRTGEAYKANETIMMLPSDMSLLQDPVYKAYIEQFASNITYLSDVFARAWYKLTTRDVGPITRCLNISIGGEYQLPSPHAFQFFVPPPATPSPDYEAAKGVIFSLLRSSTFKPAGVQPDVINGTAYWGAIFSHMAFQCAATVRVTDHLGGCNGARIRFAPQSEWAFNAGIPAVIDALVAAIQPQFPTLSISDLIVLAGTVANEDAAGASFDFCGGRGDADAGYPEGYLMRGFNLTDTTRPFDWTAKYLGLDTEHWVALQARPRSPSQLMRSGYATSGRTDVHNIAQLGPQYFANLLNEYWTPIGNGIYTNVDQSLTMTAYDMQVLWSPPHKAIAQKFVEDPAYFQYTYRTAWSTLMNMDRYSGPTGNVCL
jgi:catalase-peroxidase